MALSELLPVGEVVQADKVSQGVPVRSTVVTKSGANYPRPGEMLNANVHRETLQPVEKVSEGWEIISQGSLEVAAAVESKMLEAA